MLLGLNIRIKSKNQIIENWEVHILLNILISTYLWTDPNPVILPGPPYLKTVTVYNSSTYEVLLFLLLVDVTGFTSSFLQANTFILPCRIVALYRTMDRIRQFWMDILWTNPEILKQKLQTEKRKFFKRVSK